MAKREQWIADLKPGDTVIIQKHFESDQIALVKSVTGSGRIMLDNGMVYRPDGGEFGAKRWPSNIEQATPEYLLRIEKNNIMLRIGLPGWTCRMDIEELRALEKRRMEIDAECKAIFQQRMKE